MVAPWVGFPVGSVVPMNALGVAVVRKEPGVGPALLLVHVRPELGRGILCRSTGVVGVCGHEDQLAILVPVDVIYRDVVPFLGRCVDLVLLVLGLPGLLGEVVRQHAECLAVGLGPGKLLRGVSGEVV